MNSVSSSFYFHHWRLSSLTLDFKWFLLPTCVVCCADIPLLAHPRPSVSISSSRTHSSLRSGTYHPRIPRPALLTLGAPCLKQRQIIPETTSFYVKEEASDYYLPHKCLPLDLSIQRVAAGLSTNTTLLRGNAWDHACRALTNLRCRRIRSGQGSIRTCRKKKVRCLVPLLISTMTQLHLHVAQGPWRPFQRASMQS